MALLHYLKHPAEILEAASSTGGLCKTIWKDGFGYDIGGHILFSKHQEINEIVDHLLEGNINRCKRANKILLHGRYVKYPFENDLGSLEKQDTYECLMGYLLKDYPKPKTNLKEWAYYTFGKGISEKYFIPYNEKIWNIPAEEMSLEWVDRIPRPPMEDVVKSALGIETEGYRHQLYFRYPTRGGVEALVKALEPRGPDKTLTLNYKIRSIRRAGAHWLLSDGKTEKKFDKIVIAFPIHEAISCFEEVPKEVRDAVNNLRFNSINVVLLAVNNESLLDKSAVYIPDQSVLPHRVCFMGYFSRHLVRPGTSSLIAEITTNPGDGIHELTDSDIIERSSADLDRIGILNKKDIIVSDITRCRYGYPVYTLDYYKNIRVMREYFKSIEVDLCGRFAEFEYINSDECLRRAIGLSERLNQTPI